jgi:invasion protein IalB
MNEVAEKPPALPTLPAEAQGAFTLPGGATSLRETYGDWLVTCVAGPAGNPCVMTQELHAQNGQRALAMQVRPVPHGLGAEALLALPFGLALD